MKRKRKRYRKGGKEILMKAQRDWESRRRSYVQGSIRILKEKGFWLMSKDDKLGKG